VGSEGCQEEFLIYADLAKQHSEAIAAQIDAITGINDTKLHMPELDVSHFKIFVAFIYTGKIHTLNSASEWSLLGELWVLGKILKSTSFKDAVADAMVERRSATKEIYG
jgi:hypothetical protein